MYSFRQLQKASKTEVKGTQVRLAVLGNSATQFLSASIEGYGKLSGINLQVMDGDYDQIEAQLLTHDSETYLFNPNYVLLWLATEKLYEDFLDSTQEQKSIFAETCVVNLERYWSLIEKNSKAKVLQVNFTEIPDNALGQLSGKVEQTFTYQIRKLNYLLQEAMKKRGNVYPIDLLSIQTVMGRDTIYDAALYYNAKMPVCLNCLPHFAKAVTDVLSSMEGRIRKCVIMDLDNTLWGGVIGDDGMAGIEIGELGKGRAYSDLQRWLRELKQFGIILAVCSKNDEAVAKEPFEKHGEMVLRLSDISAFVANWNDKASNVRMIQETLNIGMDSIVFLDDNPFERGLVREKCPGITVPELPTDSALWLNYLQQLNLFDTVSFSNENAERTAQYQAEFERKKVEKTFASIDDYLENLEMKGYAGPFNQMQYPRIAQLTQRSNQFNLRTIRYTEEEVRRVAESSDYLTRYYTLRDRFGEHGLVSIVILKKISAKEVFIDSWLMSCRVLKRGMEEFVMNDIISVARENGEEIVSAEYIPTIKNKMVKDIYKTMGFDVVEENRYQINVNDYSAKKTFIRGDQSNGKK